MESLGPPETPKSPAQRPQWTAAFDHGYDSEAHRVDVTQRKQAAYGALWLIQHNAKNTATRRSQLKVIESFLKKHHFEGYNVPTFQNLLECIATECGLKASDMDDLMDQVFEVDVTTMPQNVLDHYDYDPSNPSMARLAGPRRRSSKVELPTGYMDSLKLPDDPLFSTRNAEGQRSCYIALLDIDAEKHNRGKPDHPYRDYPSQIATLASLVERFHLKYESEALRAKLQKLIKDHGSDRTPGNWARDFDHLITTGIEEVDANFYRKIRFQCHQLWENNDLPLYRRKLTQTDKPTPGLGQELVTPTRHTPERDTTPGGAGQESTLKPTHERSRTATLPRSQPPTKRLRRSLSHNLGGQEEAEAGEADTEAAGASLRASPKGPAADAESTAHRTTSMADQSTQTDNTNRRLPDITVNEIQESFRQQSHIANAAIRAIFECLQIAPGQTLPQEQFVALLYAPADKLSALYEKCFGQDWADLHRGSQELPGLSASLLLSSLIQAFTDSEVFQACPPRLTVTHVQSAILHDEVTEYLLTKGIEAENLRKLMAFRINSSASDRKQAEFHAFVGTLADLLSQIISPHVERLIAVANASWNGPQAQRDESQPGFKREITEALQLGLKLKTQMTGSRNFCSSFWPTPGEKFVISRMECLRRAGVDPGMDTRYRVAYTVAPGFVVTNTRGTIVEEKVAVRAKVELVRQAD